MNHDGHVNPAPRSRRDFIISGVRSAGALALTPLTLGHAFAAGDNRSFTVQEVIDIILKEAGVPPIRETVDTIKAGQGSTLVTGIVTTMFPTVDVIEEAAKRSANFIIVHEPSFYNHVDDTDWVPGNSVLKQKQALLEKHHITLWRFHDYCHALRPDAVAYGVVKKAGWLPYYSTGHTILTIPAVSFHQLIAHLKVSLQISNVRVIGDLTQSCSRIALMPGAAGGRRQVALVEAEKPDVLIVGETPEWETAEYIRDLRSFGGNTNLLILGHAVSEEPGMEWVAEWLKPKLPGVPVTHCASKDPFVWT